jgi:anti-anti-sigma factor
MELNLIHSDETYTHIALVGKLDVGGVGEIENKFIGYTAARKKSAVVDLSGVNFMGSMGLRIFLSSAKVLKRENKKLILLKPQPLVNEVLEASGISDLISVQHDEATAVAEAQA